MSNAQSDPDPIWYKDPTFYGLTLVVSTIFGGSWGLLAVWQLGAHPVAPIVGVAAVTVLTFFGIVIARVRGESHVE